jgi:hypothetical protein
MLTEETIRELLTEGHQISDASFVANSVEKMSRAVYLMTWFLIEEEKGKPVSSSELQQRINRHVRESPVAVVRQRFNPVDFFSQQWTLHVTPNSGHRTQYFKEEYLELFERQGTNPTSYRIKPALHESVAKIMSELRASSERGAGSSAALPAPHVAVVGSPLSPSGGDGVEEGPLLIDDISRGEHADAPSVLDGPVAELVGEGAFEPADLEDARRWDLRAVVVRQGQPQFRAALLEAYGGRCAITGCDAVPALEAAHIKPYDGILTNGILLRADIHTLFDLDLLGIDPQTLAVCIATELRATVYGKLEGRQLREPLDGSRRPSLSALAWRWASFSRRRAPQG